jgi:hypothetical protein
VGHVLGPAAERPAIVDDEDAHGLSRP